MPTNAPALPPLAHDHILDNDKDLPLLEDTQLLSRVLLKVIEQQTSAPVKQTIDALLQGEDPQTTIQAILPKLNVQQRKNLIRACGLFAQVFNIAEDMHHERRRLAYEQDEHAAKSSFAHVMDEIKAQGIDEDDLQEQLDDLGITPPFENPFDVYPCEIWVCQGKIIYLGLELLENEDRLPFAVS